MAGKTDLLLVHPGGAPKIYQNLGIELSAVETPFLAALTAGFVRHNGFGVQILDANALGHSLEETAREVARTNSEFVGIIVHGQQPSASTQLMGIVGPLCSAIKKIAPEKKIILTGTHPSALPERTLREEQCDFVGQGEGFYTFLGLLQKKQFSEIPGLWHKEGGVVRPPKLPAADIKESDLAKTLPEVAWDLLPMQKYRAHNWHCFEDIDNRKPYASLYTSFGCPYRCTFCCINAPFEKHMIRCFSPEWVITQIKILVEEYRVKNIKIIDEMFVLRPAHVEGVCAQIAKNNFGDKLNIWAYARIDSIQDTFLELLGRSGFHWLGIGVESGSKHVRDGVEKGRFNEEDIARVIKKVRAAGISIGANYIFGLPDDTMETMQQTLSLALNLNTEWANFYCAMAYPGSELYAMAKQKGLPLPDDAGGPGWIGYSQHAYETLPLPTGALSAAQVLKFRDYAYNAYFTNPQYADMLLRKFGDKAIQHIDEMNKIKLRRRLFGE